jgi:hypothetical protein
VANRGDRLALFEKVAHEIDGVFVHAERVRVGDAAGQHESIVVFGAHVADDFIDFERVGLLVVVVALNLARLERNQLGRGAGLLDGEPRLGQFDLLDAAGREKRDTLAFN